MSLINKDKSAILGMIKKPIQLFPNYALHISCDFLYLKYCICVRVIVTASGILLIAIEGDTQSRLRHVCGGQ